MCLGYVQGDISHSDSLGDVGGASYHIKGKMYSACVQSLLK